MSSGLDGCCKFQAFRCTMVRTSGCSAGVLMAHNELNKTGNKRIREQALCWICGLGATCDAHCASDHNVRGLSLAMRGPLSRSAELDRCSL